MNVIYFNTRNRNYEEREASNSIWYMYGTCIYQNILVFNIGLGDFFHLVYIVKHIYIAIFDSIIFHSVMIALQPITTGMYPSTSVTINRIFIYIVCMYF